MQRTMWLILIVYLLLAAACSALNPLFEAPDEQHHYFTARSMAETRQLPVVSEDSMARQEAAQPPLYYLLSALIIAPIDAFPTQPQLFPNPFVRLGHFDSQINVNAFAHTPEEAWPWRDTSLALHLVRLLSVLLGAGTLLCIYASGLLLWPEKPYRALLASALVGFLPQYVFLHSAVSNDSLIVFLSSAALWQLIRLWLDKATGWRVLALGITAGLAMLTKNAGVLLFALSGLAILLLAWRERKWSLVLQYGALLLLPVVVLSGWMYLRNWTLYQDVFAVSIFVEKAGGDRNLTVVQALSQLGRVWRSSVAVFGWMNLTAPDWVYWVWNGLVLLGSLGWLVKGVLLLWARVNASATDTASNESERTGRWWLIALLVLWPVLVFVSWLLFMMRTPADQGRLLFPALLPLALALAYGLSQIGRRWAFPVASILALSTSVYCVFLLLPQTYALPALIGEADIPPESTRLDRDMGLGLELVASKVEVAAVHPGETVAVTLYWRSQGATTESAIVQPEVLGQGYAQIGSQPDAHHGGGLYPSALWPSGQIIKERLVLPLEAGSATPTQGRIYARLDGHEPFVEVGSIKVVPRTWPEPDGEGVARLGEGIALTQASLGAMEAVPGSVVPVLLRWQVSQAPGRDLITFVHLGDPTQPPLAQADGPALGGDYPSYLWEAGEVFGDRYDLQLPDDMPGGRYPVHVGLYDPETGQRLPVWARDERQTHDALLVGWVDVP